MRFRTVMATASAVVAFLPATLHAQKAFEGIITWGSTMSGGRGATTIRVKGARIRTDAGDEQRGTFTTIKDESGRILMLMAPRKAYYVMGNVQSIAPKKYEATGRSETVAGYPCKDYRVLDSNGSSKDNEEVCVTTALGFVPIGAGSPMSDAAARAVREQFRDGFLILKSVRAGKTPFEVLKVEPTSLSDALFSPPADYTEMKMGARPGS